MTSLLDQIGGEDALKPVVHDFYLRLTSDELTAPFFKTANIEMLENKQTWFLTMVLCGKLEGVAHYMQISHARLVREMGLESRHFDRTMQILDRTLADAGVPQNVYREIMDKAHSLKDAVLSNLDGRLPDKGKFPEPPEHLF